MPDVPALTSGAATTGEPSTLDLTELGEIDPAVAAEAADLLSVARAMADESRGFLSTVTEVASGANPDSGIPLLLLAVSDLLAAGARLGAMLDVVPPERFEPDVGPEPDVDALRIALGNVLEGLDEYSAVVDPLLDAEVETCALSGDLVSIVGAIAQGLQHYEEGQVLEALWWWQFSYLSGWGERASSVLRVLQVLLGHLRLDVDDDVAAEAEYDALQR